MLVSQLPFYLGHALPSPEPQKLLPTATRGLPLQELVGKVKQLTGQQDPRVETLLEQLVDEDGDIDVLRFLKITQLLPDDDEGGGGGIIGHVRNVFIEAAQARDITSLSQLCDLLLGSGGGGGGEDDEDEDEDARRPMVPLPDFARLLKGELGLDLESEEAEPVNTVLRHFVDEETSVLDVSALLQQLELLPGGGGGGGGGHGGGEFAEVVEMLRDTVIEAAQQREMGREQLCRFLLEGSEGGGWLPLPTFAEAMQVGDSLTALQHTNGSWQRMWETLSPTAPVPLTASARPCRRGWVCRCSTRW